MARIAKVRGQKNPVVLATHHWQREMVHRMRELGLTMDEIAFVLGHVTRQTVHHLVHTENKHGK